MALEHVRTQYAVGQGSFHAAHVSYSGAGPGSWRFDYVYDCGALNGRKPSRAVLRAVDHFEPRTEGADTVLDALVLSHYDCDHINAAARLAASHRVQRIFLPYLSPRELLLEVAKCAEAADASALAAFYAGAFGTELWGAQVVRVARGWRPGDEDDAFKTDGGPPLPEGLPDNGRREEEGADARPFQLVVERTGQLLGAVLDDRDSVVLAATGIHAVWRLKFWNYTLADEELSCIAAALLGSIGFPLPALEVEDGAGQVLAWLAKSKNRKQAVAAYRAAITEYSKQVPQAAQVANLCSLALYSGETVNEPFDGSYWCGGLHNDWWGYRARPFHGWLGTGDAILGRPDVWADFSAHYFDELPRLSTVLVPHHGAAPKNGPSFYNVGLNPHPYMLTVISAGATNNYGHPRPSVFQEILRQRGLLRVVTEAVWPGLMERSEWD